MAFNSTALKTTLAAPILAVAFAANAQTKLPVIEPSATDLSKPVAAACVETTPGQPSLTAWDKLKTIMGARGQMIAASGDQIVQGIAPKEMMFTISNNFSGKEAYIIRSKVTKSERESSKEFCISPLETAAFVDNSKLASVPSMVNKGTLGIALTNNHNLGSKVAVMGSYSQGSLIAVHFNPETKKGAYKEADSKGNGFRDAAFFENFDYSPRMKGVIEQLSAAKPDQRIAAVDPTKLEPR